MPRVSSALCHHKSPSAPSQKKKKTWWFCGGLLFWELRFLIHAWSPKCFWSIFWILLTALHWFMVSNGVSAEFRRFQKKFVCFLDHFVYFQILNPFFFCNLPCKRRTKLKSFFFFYIIRYQSKNILCYKIRKNWKKNFLNFSNWNMPKCTVISYHEDSFIPSPNPPPVLQLWLMQLLWNRQTKFYIPWVS